MRYLALLLTLALVACESTDPPTIRAFASGSRLAVHRVRSEGVSSFIDFLDTQRGQTCSFTLAEDGRVRCLPGAGVGSFVYASSDCSGEPLLEGDLTNAPPPGSLWFYGYPRLQSCGLIGDRGIAQPVKVFEAGEKVMVGPTFARAGDGSCIALGFTGKRVAEAHVVPPESFVAAMETLIPRGRVSLLHLVADDGAELVRGLANTATGEECHSGDFDPPTLALPCLPGVLPYLQGYVGYGDANCSQPVVTGDPACPPPTYAFDFPEGCTQLRIFTLGAPPTEVFSSSSGSCERISSTGGGYRTLGPELPADFFPLIEPRLEGSGKVRAVSAEVDGVALEISRGLADAASGQPCDFTIAMDRTARCVPTRAPVLRDGANRYADPSCTKEIVPAPSLLCDERPSPVGATYVARPGDLDVLVGSFVVGEEIVRPVVYEKIDAQCAEVSPKPPYDSWLRVGERGDLGAFGAMLDGYEPRDP